ncbi:P-body assembly WD repeat protein [Schizosaccharomyces pombe]|uniref:Enhancer of mRNA-decapping protein 4-like protein pdc1 n=1 Tax=Schizosaccharomyces pombe (strain 972 / ATCC 24843) TaxID=284812 RepID=EDC4L_SCHPO|nr:uncharacterized protein SPAC20G4.08 [Schizosaccharomyces pombe]O13892.2 RecName: Full=Uncharacterized protein C20G4.08 [Schizosaccharomyces pombe 972h-]CAB11257.2 conserved fungal protein [Schizosaccharomyces pombe]|eukprot:NP_001342843.1 uncharacterized protein SPAC20G4.08 [Schizosaccharomyces pombe]
MNEQDLLNSLRRDLNLPNLGKSHDGSEAVESTFPEKKESSLSAQQPHVDDQRSSLLSLLNAGLNASNQSPSNSGPKYYASHSSSTDALLQAFRDGAKPSGTASGADVKRSDSESTEATSNERPFNPVSAANLERLLMSSTGPQTPINGELKSNDSQDTAFQSSRNMPSDTSVASPDYSHSQSSSPIANYQESGNSEEPHKAEEQQQLSIYQLDNPGSGNYVWETVISPDKFETSTFAKCERNDIAIINRELDAQDNQLIHTNEDFIAYAVHREPIIRVIEISTGKSFLLHNNSPNKFVSVAWGNDSVIKNRLMAIDTTGQVLIFAVDIATSTSEIIFQLSGAQSLSDPIKSRFHWYPKSSTRFAVALSKHIIFFDLDLLNNISFPIPRSINAIQQLPCFLIDTGISAKEYDFSYDGTVFATVDKDALIKIYTVPTTFPSTPDKRPVPSEVSPIAIFTTRMERGPSKNYEKPINLRFISTPGTNNSRYLVIVYVMNQLITLFDLYSKRNIQTFRFNNRPTAATTTSFSQFSVDNERSTLLVGNPPSNSIYFFLFAKDETVSEQAPIYNSTYELILASLNTSEPVPADAKFSVIVAKKFEKAACISFTACKILESEDKYCIVVSNTDGYEYYSIPTSILDKTGKTVRSLESVQNYDADIGGTIDLTERHSTASPSTVNSGFSTPRSQATGFSKKKKDKGERFETKDKSSSVLSPSSYSASTFDAIPMDSIVSNILASLEKSVHKNYESLRSQLLEYKAANEKHTEAILSVVSSTLTENTGKILESVVEKSMQVALKEEIANSVRNALKNNLEKIESFLENSIAELQNSVREDFDKQTSSLAQLRYSIQNVAHAQKESEVKYNELNEQVKTLEGYVETVLEKFNDLKIENKVPETAPDVVPSSYPPAAESNVSVSSDTSTKDVEKQEPSSAEQPAQGIAESLRRLKEYVKAGSVKECVAEWCNMPSVAGFDVLSEISYDRMLENCSNLLLLTFIYHISLLDSVDDDRLSKRMEYISRICLNIDVNDPKVETVVHPVLTLTREALLRQSEFFSPIFKRRLVVLLRALDGKISEISVASSN